MRLSLLTCLAIGSVQGFSGFHISTLRVRQVDNCAISYSLSDDDGCDRPPAFTIEGEEEEAVATSKRKEYGGPPDFGDDDNPNVLSSTTKPKAKTSSPRADEDSYSEDMSARPRQPRRPRQPKKVRITSWMEKNQKFTNQVENEPPVSNNNRFESSSLPQRKSQGPPPASKTFRQDFRGTRVFVQGIPPGVSWQDLKDHFRIAGDVVFASVSVDIETGASKGHGIVQFETTEMARNAIEIMREHPLDGAQLFVREDYQDANDGANLRPSSSAMRSRSTPPNVWKCANEENAMYMDEGEVAVIKSLIKARDDARKRKKYEVSDQIREELKISHGVFVDDRLKMWWTSIDGQKVPQTVQDIKGDGRWKLKPWRQIPTTPENDMCVDPELVEGLLKQRDIARREKDFSTADALLEQARTSPDGDLELRIHDESRTWRIWTDAPPPRPVEQQPQRFSKDPTEARKEAAIQCIEIVKEYAPHKLDEIKMLIAKFPGREFQMLKRLKNQYE